MHHQWPYSYPYYPYVYHQFPFKNSPSFQQAIPPVPRKQKTEKSNQQVEETKKQKDASVTISKQIQKIYEKLNQLEEEQQQLKEDIENMNPVTIENINYKIQDLNVQDLSGNLLVGLTALSDAEKLQELLSENGAVKFNDVDTDQFTNQMMNEQNENNEEKQDG